MLIKLCFFIICVIFIISICVFFHLFLKEYLNDLATYVKKLYNKLVNIKPNPI